MKSSDMKQMGQGSFMVWIPTGLKKAVREKLAKDGITARQLMIRFLTRYTGYVEKGEENGKIA